MSPRSEEFLDRARRRLAAARHAIDAGDPEEFTPAEAESILGDARRFVDEVRSALG